MLSIVPQEAKAVSGEFAIRKRKPNRKGENVNGDTAAEMPRYKSHKEVWALKIKAIEYDHDVATRENRETDGSATITPEDPGYAPFKVPHAYVRKHEPKVGGYYVVYKDGYASFSPAEAFEEGYTRL